MRHQWVSNKQIILWCLLSFIGLSISSTIFAETDARSLKHPLVGYWESTIRETGCLESYWFKEDGTAVFTSGDEQLEAHYEVSPQPDGQGFFKLTHRVTLSNKKLDCTRQTSEVNNEQSSYVLFQPDGRSFIACDDDNPSLETCFGPIELKNNATKSLP
ncbi:MAG TPA: hypothetical protein VK950_01190 [Methylophilus sp.]|nr:hypothetical protein [Methylophilus sp.]